MNFRTKITLLSSIWLIAILILVDAAVYALFIKVAGRNENDALLRRAEMIVSELGTDVLLAPRNERMLRKYLTEHSMIRTVDRHSHIINLMNNDPRVTAIPPICADSTTATQYKAGGERIRVVRMPLLVREEAAGGIEVAMLSPALQKNIRALITIMVFSTMIAVLLSLLGAAFFTSTLMKPIVRLVEAMEAIESSLVFKRIPLPGNDSGDELYKLTATFNRMMTRIEDGFRKQQQFVSDASHELKTTLTVIEGYAGMLRRWGFRDEQVFREAVDSIYDESLRMKKMTQQLLDLASAEKKDRPAYEMVNLVPLCTQVAKTVERLIKRPIRVQAPTGEVDVPADPLMLKQVLHILLDNAVKYSTSGIDIEVGFEEEWRTIRVRDYGIGIPEEHLPRVFERFYRVDQARQRKTGGTGLGLSIARSIVMQHGGTIEIASKEGEGTAVTIRLPAR